RRQTDFLKPMKRHNPFVIDDSAIWTKRDLLRLVALVRFHRFGKSANRQLCRQTKALTHVVVQGFLQLKLRGTALLEGVPRNPPRTLSGGCLPELAVVDVHAALKACIVSNKAVC